MARFYLLQISQVLREKSCTWRTFEVVVDTSNDFYREKEGRGEILKQKNEMRFSVQIGRFTPGEMDDKCDQT